MPGPKTLDQASGAMGYNVDRTIAILAANHVENSDPKKLNIKSVVEQVLTAAGVGYYIAPGDIAGFDQFGTDRSLRRLDSWLVKLESRNFLFAEGGKPNFGSR